MASEAPSRAIRAKASRLLADGRVAVGIAGYVVGDHGDYVVAVRGSNLSCDCPARVKRCAHVVAVATILEKARKQ